MSCNDSVNSTLTCGLELYCFSQLVRINTTKSSLLVLFVFMQQNCHNRDHYHCFTTFLSYAICKRKFGCTVC